MSMTNREYNEYMERMDRINDYGTREAMEALYDEILCTTGDRENLHRLDSLHNSRFSIDY